MPNYLVGTVLSFKSTFAGSINQKIDEPLSS